MLKVAVNSRFGSRYVTVREPTGREELDLAVGHPVTQAEALSRLVLPHSQSRVLALSLAERDRIFAALYQFCFGDYVESVLNCNLCHKAYEFGFSLGEFVSEFDAPTGERSASAGPHEAPDARDPAPLSPLPVADAHGVFTLKPGVRFRLPRVDDEILLAELDENLLQSTLLARCLVEGDAERDGDAVEAQMERLAPLLRRALDSECPHCSAAQTVEFDLVSYVQRCFERERALLTREIHCLASAYRFGYDEILSMPRRLRQEMVQLLLAQRDRGAA